MKTKTIFEEELLKEVQDLPEPAQERMVKIVRFFKKEIIQPGANEKEATRELLSVCGAWEDIRSVEEQLNDIHSSRKSTDRTEKIF
ncbi:MAG: hypothetical protein HZA02_00675 [Nitrospinae bacterium]|nr:hypothetical protein [Nitrospinota bacterium]